MNISINKKVIHFILLSFILLCASTLRGQQFTIDSVPDKLAGSWAFKSAEFVTLPQGGGAALETKKITDAAQLENAGFPFETAFKQVNISGRQMNCLLAGRLYGNNLYKLEKQGFALVESKEKQDELKKGGMQAAPAFIPLQSYTCDAIGNEIRITSTFPFASSQHNFPLEGKLTVILTKE